MATSTLKRLLLTLLFLLPATVAATDNKRLVRDAVAVARELRVSENIFDQFAGAGILVDIGDKDSLQFLADSLGHPEWSIMRSAIDTLLNVQHPAGVDLIYRYAAITEDKVFMKFLSESLAARPREDMAEFLMESIALDDPWVRKHALQALATSGLDDKVARMRPIAEDREVDSVSRAYAWYALIDTEAQEESIDNLIAIAGLGSSEAKEAAAVGLGQVDNPSTRASLRTLRETGIYKVKVAALASEAGFGDDESIDMLVRIIATGDGLDASDAAASVRRLPSAVARRVTDNLFECCKLNSDVGTRLLESWASVSPVPETVYRWGLEHENPDIRLQAAWLIGTRNAREYLDELAGMLKDKDDGIRGMAAWAIVRMLGDEYDPGVET